MRQRTKTTYDIAVAWMEKNIYTPGAEDRGLAQNVCVRLTADIFRRNPMDVAKDVYLARVERDAKESHISNAEKEERRSKIKRIK